MESFIMLISVHLPKTAGTSLLDVYREHFKNGLKIDYHYSRLESVPIGTKCVHGHFKASKYAGYPDARFVTWMRDPVARAVSHYNYWKTHGLPKSDGNPLRKKVKQGMPFSDFVFDPWIVNLCTRYMEGVSFEFVGIFEKIKQQFPAFSEQFIPKDGHFPATLIPTVPVTRIDQYVDDELETEIRMEHHDDQFLYETAQIGLLSGKLITRDEDGELLLV